jgi:hypothetical protein
MKISAICAPFSAALAHPDEVSQRQFDDVEAFCAAVGVAAGVPVSIIEGDYADAPSEGFVIVYDRENDVPPGLGPRIVLVDVHGLPFKRLETHRFAALIESRRYHQWRAERDRETGAGLYARKDVAVRIGATISDPYSVTEHYAPIAHPRCRDLPEFLGLYLTALERS